MISVARARDLLKHKLVKNAGALVVVQMTTYLAPLLVMPYLARVLSPAHIGLIAIATSFNYYFIALVEYGFNLTATRRVAIYRDDPEQLAKICSSVYTAKALLTVLGFTIMLAVVLLTPNFRPHLSLFCLTYLAVVGDLLFPVWLFQGLQNMQNLMWRDLVTKFLSLVLMFAFVRNDNDYLLAAGFQAGSTVIAGIVGLITVRTVAKIRLVRPSMGETITALREGWPVFISMAAFTLSSSTSIFILGLRSGPVDVAYYMGAYRLVIAVRALVDPVKTAIYPHISHMAARSKEDAVLFLRKYGLILASPFLLVSLSLIVLAPWIVHILYTSRYNPTILLLQIQAMSPFLLAFQHNYSTFFMLAFGYDKAFSRLVLQMTVLNFVILIPAIYLLWPPLAVSITGLVLDTFMAVMTYLFYRKHSTFALQPIPA